MSNFATTPRPAGWVPDQPPDLNGVTELFVDTETKGLRWWAGETPVSISLCTKDGLQWFLPFGHADGNLDEETVRRWAHRELRGKHIRFFNAAFDINQMWHWGVDLEGQGCTVSDAAHYVALLDDHRRQSSLDSCARDYLGEQKVQGLDKTRMAHYPAWDVEAYAKKDAWLVWKLTDRCWPLLDKEDLQRVRQLEDECVYATAEMERNGAPLDEEKLDLWLRQSESDYVDCLFRLQKELGWGDNLPLFDDIQGGEPFNPASTQHLRRAFDKLGIKYPVSRDPHLLRQGITDKVTFEKRYLAEIDHPTVKLIRRAKRLHSVRAKYLVPYKEELRKNGLLRYALHQLRASDDDDSADAGTISGRYSSSAYSTGDGKNIQQVAGKKFQHSVKEEAHWMYNIRELFVPGQRGWLSLAGDADQIEYRWFAHYARPKHVMDAYARDPKTNFHKAVQEMIEKFQAITYELTKDMNFAGLFGAGLEQFAFMLFMTENRARPIYELYHQALPEAKQLYRRAKKLAEHHGWVKTVLGRLARFPLKEFCSKAVSRVIQGSAADENKTKLVALRKAKTGMVLRFTVHDEAYGDVPDEETARMVNEVLNTQILPCRVPLLWTVKTGPNWQECKKAA